ncbi:MAG: DUF1559 domain-containing protein [Kiritimatiellia bacterium]|jgi:prepilin-type processing-associated H-X9-DG protein|nr:DUF1559 domain-containing protein [Kiritimatiellia bacterium]
MGKGVRRCLFGLAGLLVLGVVVLYFLLPAIACSRERLPRISCANNLKQIGLGIKMYAADHGKAFPPRFVDIRNYMADQASMFICPTFGNEPGPIGTVDEWTDYAYVVGLSETNAPNTIVMYCHPKNHGGDGANILFLDGHCEWFNSEGKTSGETSFEDMIRQAREQGKP